MRPTNNPHSSPMRLGFPHFEPLQKGARETRIIEFVEEVLLHAVAEGASDIHFEPYEAAFRIRYRVDGRLYALPSLAFELTRSILSRIKVLAELDIAEHRLPQDGRISFKAGEREVDVRVATLPTRFGESIVLRILDKERACLDLDRLGMPDTLCAQVRALMKGRNGIFIVTGPTGSGKTTTLYSALREIDLSRNKVITVEDPVEYTVKGLLQIAVDSRIGLTFARVLRALLRHDPDTIMIGEIRDLETAHIAVQAALTGHLVLSTLHTQNAPSAVVRLLNMGVQPFLISASLRAVLAQRLVRRICPSCSTEQLPKPETLDCLGWDAKGAAFSGGSFHYGTGCDACRRTGFSGRRGLFEMMMLSDPLRALINRRPSVAALRQKALDEGLCTLREDGLRQVRDGVTTLEEVLEST